MKRMSLAEVLSMSLRAGIANIVRYDSPLKSFLEANDTPELIGNGHIVINIVKQHYSEDYMIASNLVPERF